MWCGGQEREGQERNIRAAAMKQRAIGGGATGAGGAVGDVGGTRARFGPQRREAGAVSAYQGWDAEEHLGLDAYADYTQRHHDPRERSINDRHTDNVRNIQSGAVAYQARSMLPPLLS